MVVTPNTIDQSLESEIELYLDKINRISNIDNLLNTQVNHDFTIDYYTRTSKYYRKYHSGSGAMHFPIHETKGQLSHDQALSQQPQYIHDLLQNKLVKQVLELGCGPGYNSHFLARKNPTIDFKGIDLTPLHVAEGNEKAKSLNNLHFVEGNFQALPFDDESVDLVFAVETLCHAGDLSLAIGEAYRVLRPGGSLIIFDGYGTHLISTASEKIQQAARLFAIGFAIENAQILSHCLATAESLGFQLIRQEELTAAILPNFIRFQKGVQQLFRFPLLTRLLLKSGLLPKPLFRHSIAGLLGPLLLKGKYSGYYQIEFSKGQIINSRFSSNSEEITD